MSRIHICIVVLCATLSSCSNDRNAHVYQDGQLRWACPIPVLNSRIIKLVEQNLLRDTSSGHIYELYIDKYDEVSRTTYIVLRLRPYSKEYLHRIRPNAIATIRGRDFLVFSGLEDYLSDCDSITSQGTQNMALSREWSSLRFKDSAGTLRQMSGLGIPFAAGMTEEPPIAVPDSGISGQ
jgi:hypothetical protein